MESSSSTLTVTLAAARAYSRKERLVVALCGATALVGTFLPHFTRLNRDFTLLSLLTGVGAGVAYSSTIIQRHTKERIASALEAGETLATKQNITAVITKESAENEITHANDLLNYIMTLPEHQRPYWLNKFGLQYIAPPTYTPEEEYIEIEAAPPVMTGVNQEGFGAVKDAEIQNRLDDLYTWVDNEFLLSSKAVVGEMGSGKSMVLYLEAKYFVTTQPEGELRIADKHFDDDSQWLLGVPRALVREKFIVKSMEDTLETFRYVYRELLRRIERGDKKGRPLKFICDEFVNFVSLLEFHDKEHKTSYVDEVKRIISQINFESRKYNIFLTLGLHSIKKEVTGLDSAVISNFYLLLLGDTAGDSTVKFSRSFDFSTLLPERDQLAAMITPDMGRVAIFKPRGDKPRVVLIPFIRESDLLIDYREPPHPQGTEANPATEIYEWYEGLKADVTTEAIAQKWFELTGQRLDQEGLSYLVAKLRDKYAATDQDL